MRKRAPTEVWAVVPSPGCVAGALMCQRRSRAGTVQADAPEQPTGMHLTAPMKCLYSGLDGGPRSLTQ